MREAGGVTIWSASLDAAPAAAAPAVGRTASGARAESLRALAAEPFDVVVVGGGITGAGVARDAALRGLRVALVERDDWASGTSSRSSRLVHGGVRYLEHGHLGLVFEASRERRLLLHLAPHLVRPLAFTWPVYRGARVPRWKLRAGLLLYDALALFRNVGRHRALAAGDVLAHEPALAAAGLTGGARYWDAATDDARLTLATALGAREGGAVVLNHAEVAGLRLDPPDAAPGGAAGVRARLVVRDRIGGGCVELRGRAVVNAAGPWGDRVRRLADPAAPAAVLGAKGVHVAVPARRVGNRGALTLLSPRDGRVMFVLPAGPLTILGTTETPAERGPDEVRATEADVAYLLDAVNAAFPGARLGRDDVVSAWAGVRPLAAASVGTAGSGGTGSASREHAIDVDPRGLVTVSGGKLTTYRAMAAEVVERTAAALLGVRLPPSPTATIPLPGGELASVGAASLADLERAAGARVGDAAVAARLVRAFGARWPAVWALAEADPALARRIVPELPYVGAELAHAVAHEQGATLADLLVRRTPIAFETPDAGRRAARRVAPLLAPALGWDAADVEGALAGYDREAARLFAVDD